MRLKARIAYDLPHQLCQIVEMLAELHDRIIWMSVVNRVERENAGFPQRALNGPVVAQVLYGHAHVRSALAHHRHEGPNVRRNLAHIRHSANLKLMRPEQATACSQKA